MARMRSIKPEFWADEDLAELTRDARLLYVGLWNLSDEHGRLRGDPRYVKGQLFPYDDDLTPSDVDQMLDELAKAKKVVRYGVDGGRYLFLPNLAKHQRLESDKVPSRLPSPAETQDPDSSVPVSEVRADESAPDADESKLARARLFSMEHVAGSREHVAGGLSRTDVRQSRPRSRSDAEFDEFWSAYPRKEAKGAARKAWDKAIQRADPDRIREGAQRYRDDPARDPVFTTHGATWLNADRWLDEPTPRARASPTGQREVNGLMLNDRTIENLEREKRMAELDAANQQLTIGGNP